MEYVSLGFRREPRAIKRGIADVSADICRYTCKALRLGEATEGRGDGCQGREVQHLKVKKKTPTPENCRPKPERWQEREQTGRPSEDAF